MKSTLNPAEFLVNSINCEFHSGIVSLGDDLQPNFPHSKNFLSFFLQKSKHFGWRYGGAEDT